MEYLFDGLMFSIILFCFIRAKEPKQTALLVCLFVSLFGYLINQVSPVNYLYSSLAIAESLGAAIIMVLSFGVDRKNKVFFYLMSGFLAASVINNGLMMPLYKYTDMGSFQVYSLCYQAIAVCHVLTMLAFSDVIRNTIRGVRGCRNNYNPAGGDMRGDA